MVSANYMRNRKKYYRPQGLLFSDNPGQIQNYGSENGIGYYAPDGYEFGYYDQGTDHFIEPNWMVLTDDNRKEIGLTFERVEQRKRMINARMRSVHVADKVKISCSWDMIPSRAFDIPNLADLDNGEDIGAVNETTGQLTDSTLEEGLSSEATTLLANTENLDPPPTKLRSWNVEPYRFTTDAGAGGADMLRWYKNHSGSFWVFLAYDNFHNFDTLANSNDPWSKLNRYNERIEVYFADFQYNIVKRGQRFDFWNVSLSLEEV